MADRPSRWRVRQAGAHDRATLLALVAEVDATHARLQPTFFRAPSGDGWRERVERELDEALASPSRAVLVAEDETGSVRGLVEVQLYETPRSPAMAPCRRAQFEVLVVAPTCRRGGCGRALAERGAAWARQRGASQLVLTVWAGNEAAERFYAALGYRLVNQVLGTTL